jgi:hypothetical protein
MTNETPTGVSKELAWEEAYRLTVAGVGVTDHLKFCEERVWVAVENEDGWTVELR